MNVLQLDPQIPMRVVKNDYGIPTGECNAIFLTDHSQDHCKIWTVAFYDGQIWDVRNPYVRIDNNQTLGRKCCE